MNTEFRFLDLPGGLRNQIYELALTVRDGLYYDSPRPDIPEKPLLRTKDNNKGFNSLKYVNKQLYRETVGLEVRFNVLKFPGPIASEGEHCLAYYENPLKVFLQVAHTFTPNYLSRLKTVQLTTVANKLFESRPILFGLARLCAQYPHLNLRIVISDWECIKSDSLPGWEFWNIGLCLTYAFQGKESGDLLQDSGYIHLYSDEVSADPCWRETWVTNNTFSASRPKNMRVYPFPRTNLPLEDVYPLDRDCYAFRIEKWRDWVQNGI